MTAANRSPDDAIEIQAVLERRAAAMRAKDAARYVTEFDPSIVKFDLAPPLQESGPLVLDPAGLQWWLDTWDGDSAPFYMDGELRPALDLKP